MSRVNQRSLRRPLKEEFGVAGNILVKCTRGCDHQSQRLFLPSAGTAHLLAGSGDAAGIAAEQHTLQFADVDTQLKRIGGDHTANSPTAKTGLDRPSFFRQIAASIAADCLFEVVDNFLVGSLRNLADTLAGYN